MKNVLYYHPVGYSNPGDDITYHGGLEIMKLSIGNHNIYNFCTEDLKSITSENIEIFKKCDILVIPGTPWIWNNCNLTPKYDVLKFVLSFFKDKKKIALGIGSGFPLNYSYTETFNHLVEFWKDFDFISTRDFICSSVLNKAGIYSYSTFCTSVFYPYYKEKNSSNNKPTLVFYNPKTWGHGRYLTEEYLDRYVQFQIDFINKYNPNILVLDNSEMEFINNMGRECHKVSSHEDVVSKLSTSSFVVSGRIHSAIPARMMNIPAYILPVDSRWNTTINFGITPIINFETNNLFPDSHIKLNNLKDISIKEANVISSMIKEKLAN